MAIVFSALLLSGPVCIRGPREPSLSSDSAIPESGPRWPEMFGKPHVTSPAGWGRVPLLVAVG